MKLTDENQDWMDCRPPTGEVNWEMVPEHMRERMKYRMAERASAACKGQQPVTGNDNEDHTSERR